MLQLCYADAPCPFFNVFLEPHLCNIDDKLLRKIVVFQHTQRRAKPADAIRRMRIA